MSDKWLSYVNLSDHYERKARFIPGVLSVLPSVPVSAAYGITPGDWVAALISGVGMGAVIAVAISHMASAFGNRLQRELWPDWPHDFPTNRWLFPENGEVSLQQRTLWCQSIKLLTGLDIESAIRDGDRGEVRRIINDAVAALRNLLWKVPEAERLRLHNVDYGFARNLTGLRPIWVTLAIASALGCWAGFIWLGYRPFWCIVSTAIAVIVIPIGYFVLPGYVREKAHHYAESFFAAVMALSRA